MITTRKTLIWDGNFRRTNDRSCDILVIWIKKGDGRKKRLSN